MSTKATPAPTAAPAPTPAPAGLANLPVVPTTGLDNSSTKVSKYGLTNPDAQIHLGALAPILGLKTTKDSNGVPMVSAIDALNAFAAADAQTQAQIQSQLKWAGYYGSSSNLTYGRVATQDLEAFAKSLNDADTAQVGITKYNTDHPQTPRTAFDYSQNLSQAASSGQQFGVQAAIQTRLGNLQQAMATSAGGPPIQEEHYNKDQVYTIADRTAEHLLGRSLSDQEKADLYASIGLRNAGAVAKAQAKAGLLDKAYSETLTASQNVNTALTGNVAGDTIPARQGGRRADTLLVGEQANPRTAQAFEQANDAQTPVTVDTFLAAMRKTADNADNPFGFTPTTWSAYARQAGLGSDANMTAANQEVVARYLAMNMFTKYGSWAAVTAGFAQGPSAAAQYATNPESPRWNLPASTGATVAGRVNAILGALNGDPNNNIARLPRTTTPRTDLGDVTFGPSTGKNTLAAARAGAFGSTSAMPQVINTEVTPYDPTDIVEQKIKAEHPDEYGAHNIANTLGNFLSLLGGIGANNVSGYGPSGTPT